MNITSQIETLESEVKIKEQYLLSLRELSANLIEHLPDNVIVYLDK